MTAVYLVERKAEDLRLGDMFISWAMVWDQEMKVVPKRILNIREAKGKVVLSLDDCSTLQLHREHVVIVQETA